MNERGSGVKVFWTNCLKIWSLPGSAACWLWDRENKNPSLPGSFPATLLSEAEEQNLNLPGWQSEVFVLWGCCIVPYAHTSLGLEAGSRSSNTAFHVVADTSVITPITCLCIMEMGTRPSSTCLGYPFGSQPGCWAKPCKSSSRTCWRSWESLSLKPRSQKTQPWRFQPRGTNWGTAPLEKIKCFNPVCRVQLCFERLLKNGL